MTEPPPKRALWPRAALGGVKYACLVAAFFFSPLAAGQAKSGVPHVPKNSRAEIADLLAKVRAYAAHRTRQEMLGDANLAMALVKIEKTRMLLSMYRANEFRDRVVAKELAAARQALQRSEGGKPTNRDARGLIEKAYLAENDFSPQPYVVYVPRSYQRGKPCGLYVFLHGYASYLDKVNWVELMFSDVLGDLCEKLNMIAVLPFGRSNTEFMGVGEADVLHVIDLVRREYDIDEDRIFLSGGSMGGSGTYTIAAHYPHRFAGIVPISGRASYYLWKDLDPSAMPPFKRIQTDIDYAQAFPANLANLRVFIFHGEKDSLLKVEQSRQFYRTLKAVGCDVRYHEFPGLDHWIWGDVFSLSELRSWLAQTRRNPFPQRVRFRTYTLKYDRAYWVRIDHIKRWGEPADIDASLGSGGSVRVRCTNVSALTFDLPPDRLGGQPLRLLCNGKPLATQKSDAGYSAQLAPVPQSRFRKTRDVCGPVREAYNTRFVFVYGTQRNANECRATATQAARRWIAFAAGRATLIPDKSISREYTERCNLILFGGPEENAYVKRIAPDMPIKIDEKAFRVGERRFSRKDCSLLMIYPNPLNPRRYVVLNVGRLWGTSLSRNHVWDFVPDFILFGAGVDADGTDRYECAGYFDSAWQLSPRATWLRARGQGK